MKAQLRLERLMRQYEYCKLTKEEISAHLEKKVVGRRIIGIMGPYVIRYHKGKPVISERALIYKQSTSRASIEGRKNFADKVKFAQVLNNIKEVKHIWGKADLDGHSAWNRIIKYNRITGLHPIVSNTITPASNHFIVKNICSLTEDFKLKINAKLNESEKLVVVLSVYEPKDKNDNPFEIFCIEGSRLSADQIRTCRKYRKYIIYSAVIKGNEWSNTVAEEGEINFAFCGEEEVLYWQLVTQKYSASKSVSNRIISYKPT